MAVNVPDSGTHTTAVGIIVEGADPTAVQDFMNSRSGTQRLDYLKLILGDPVAFAPATETPGSAVVDATVVNIWTTPEERDLLLTAKDDMPNPLSTRVHVFETTTVPFWTQANALGFFRMEIQ